MKTFEKAQVGDKVYDLLEGEGIINSVDYHNILPISVRFKEYELCYTHEGKTSSKSKTARLYWSKPEIIAPEAPKRLVDKVLTVYANVYPRHSFNSIRNHGDYSLGELYSDKQQCLSLNSGTTIFKGAEVTIKFQVEE